MNPKNDKNILIKTPIEGGFITYVIGFSSFILLPLANFLPLWLAPLLVFAGAAALGSLIVTKRLHLLPYLRIKSFSILVFIFWIWCVLSFLWTIGYKETGLEVLRLGLLFTLIPLFAWANAASTSDRDLIGRFLFWGCCLGILLFLIQIFLGKTFLFLLSPKLGAIPISPFQQLNRAAAVLAVIMWPAIIWLWQKKSRFGSLIFWLINIFILWSLDNETAFFSAAVASILAVFVWVSPRKLVKIFSLLLFMIIATAPMLPLTVLSPEKWLEFSCNYTSPSFLHRLYIWQFATKKIIEKPFIGWGLNTARIMPGGHDVIEIKPPCSKNRTTGESLPLHTHNAFLQIWLELGGIGAVIAAGILVVVNLAIRSASRAVAAFSQAQFISAVLISGLSFGAWQSWWLSLLWLSALVTTSIRDENAID